MRKYLKLILVTTTIFLSFNSLYAQNAKKLNMKKPEIVALTFMQRFVQFEFESAKDLTTEDSKQLFAFIEMALSSMGEDEMKTAKEEAKVKVKNLNKATCKINKDEATCTFCCDENKQPISDSELKLKKVNGKWYVHMSKEDMMNDQEIPEEAPIDGE